MRQIADGSIVENTPENQNQNQNQKHKIQNFLVCIFLPGAVKNNHRH